MEAAIRRQQQLGQDLYRQKKLDEALKCFSKIIEEYVDPPIGVFDNRAACYLRLGDLPNALKDGGTMMRIAKGKAQGYLRTAQVFQKMGKDEKALAIYKYGLSNVPVSDADHKSLKEMNDKLLSRCSPPKVFDPFLMLPFELVEMVLDHLTFRELVKILRVSRQWKELLRSIHKLWRSIDFSDTRGKIPLSAVKRYVTYSQKSTTRAVLRAADTENGDAIKHLVGHCRNLEHLELLDGVSNGSLIRIAPFARCLKTLIIGKPREITLDAVTQLVENCKSLVCAKFNSVITSRQNLAIWKEDCPKLRTLHLITTTNSISHDLQRLNLHNLFPRIPNIQNLTIVNFNDVSLSADAPDFSSLGHLESLDFEGFPPDHTPILPSSIRSLRLVKSFGLAIEGLENLTSLSIPHSNQVLPSDLWVLLQAGKGKLESLTLNHSTQIDMESLIIDMCEQGYLPKIVDLTLKESGITDKVLESIATSCPMLKSLDISYSEGVTGVGVKALVLKKGEKLKNLELTHCSGVGKDAVQWAQQQGVRVVHFFPDPKRNTGRRVRY